MNGRFFLFLAAFAAVASVSGCDTLSQMQSWLPGSGAPSFDITRDKPSLEAQFHGVTLKSAKPDDSGTEMSLQLDGKADAEEFAAFQRRVPDWILGTHTDGETADIVSRAVSDFSAEPTSDGFMLKVKPRDGTAAADTTASVTEVAEDPATACSARTLTRHLVSRKRRRSKHRRAAAYRYHSYSGVVMMRRKRCASIRFVSRYRVSVSSPT